MYPQSELERAGALHCRRFATGPTRALPALLATASSPRRGSVRRRVFKYAAAAHLRPRDTGSARRRRHHVAHRIGVEAAPLGLDRFAGRLEFYPLRTAYCPAEVGINSRRPTARRRTRGPVTAPTRSSIPNRHVPRGRLDEHGRFSTRKLRAARSRTRRCRELRGHAACRTRPRAHARRAVRSGASATATVRLSDLVGASSGWPNVAARLRSGAGRAVIVAPPRGGVAAGVPDPSAEWARGHGRADRGRRIDVRSRRVRGVPRRQSIFALVDAAVRARSRTRCRRPHAESAEARSAARTPGVLRRGVVATCRRARWRPTHDVSSRDLRVRDRDRLLGPWKRSLRRSRCLAATFGTGRLPAATHRSARRVLAELDRTTSSTPPPHHVPTPPFVAVRPRLDRRWSRRREVTRPPSCRQLDGGLGGSWSSSGGAPAEVPAGR